jgi:short-subunit dehydrogenase
VTTYAGRSIVLTGASSGIGRALALALAEQRPKLLLVARDEARLREVASECERRGAAAAVLAADLTREDAAARVVDAAASAYGGIDVLVNNAGSGMMARFDELTDLAVFESLMRVNYLACVYLTHRALPHLKASRGQVVVMASLAGLTGVPTRTAYAASKHAVIGFFDSLRVELAGSGVDVTVIAPDFVDSEIHRRSIGADGRPLGKSPMQEAKIMSAEECAALTVRAMERRQRLAVLSARGRWGRIVRVFAPGLIDRIAARAVREGK